MFQIDEMMFLKLVSKKEPYGTKKALKYFIGYNDNDANRPLCLRLSKMTGYTRTFKENTTMSLRVNDKQLLKSYNKIISGTDDDKYIKTKLKIYAGSIITLFHN